MGDVQRALGTPDPTCETVGVGIGFMEDVAPELIFEESIKVSKIKYAVRLNMWYEYSSKGKKQKQSSREARENMAHSVILNSFVRLGHRKPGEKVIARAVSPYPKFLPRYKQKMFNNN